MSINLQKEYIFGFSEIYFAHFWRENSNIGNNITVLQNREKLELALKKNINEKPIKCIWHEDIKFMRKIIF